MPQTPSVFNPRGHLLYNQPVGLTPLASFTASTATLLVPRPRPNMSSPQLTDETYADFVASNSFAVVHCWAAWNGYDHQMRVALADQMPHFPRIAFAEFDVDPPDHNDICRDLNVHGPPFLALYRNGVLVTTRVGLIEPADLHTLLDGVLNPAT